MEGRRRFLGKAALAGAAAWSGFRLPAVAQEAKPGAAPPADVDVTAEWAKLHADPKAAPGTTYKAGHVAASPAKPVVTKDASGFTIQLPGGAPVPTPAVYQDRLYVSGGFRGKQYFCFEAATGKPVWGVELDDDGPSTAACEDDLVAVNTESCTLFVLEAATGKGVWAWWLGDPLLSAPTIAKGRVFSTYPANGRNFHKEASHLLGAFDLRTGKILWQRWIDGEAISAPVAVGEEILLATFTGTVFRFRQESGELLSAVKSRATSAPVSVGNELHFSRRSEKDGAAQEALCVWERGGGGKFAATFGEKRAIYLDKKVQDAAALKVQADQLDAGNGFAGGAPQTAKALEAGDNVGQGNVSTLQAFQGSRVLRVGENNLTCMGDEVICADPRGGKRVWAVKLKGDLAKAGGFLGAPPVAAGGQVFLTTLAGSVLQLDPATGETRKSWDLKRPMRFPPVVEGGRIFVGTHDGRVVCLETSDPKLTGWPQWGGNAQRTGVAAGS
jgi:outer membrane protein assembly factor BamB